MVRVPLQPIEVHGGAHFLPAACGGPHARADGCPLKEAVTPWGACAGAGSLQDLSPCGEESMLEQPVPEGLHPMEKTHTGPLHEELQSGRRTHIGRVHEGPTARGGTPHWIRARV
ncbi:hypothetical protein llap_5872 [Limosa lapponica baueri]|uniref:Uncharacterized protein n=1 Tax=Limosa lapponica baueri TaxID=1758121 RepID=A0A2I0UCM1_LIMLA|nr:hypothetical protein llap_5872 [Limosa lapponica baueri]